MARISADQLTHYRLIGSRLQLHTYARYGVGLLILLGTLLAERTFGIRGIATTVLLITTGVIFAYNSIGLLLLGSLRSAEQEPPAQRRLFTVMYVTIALDYICLTMVVWAVGGSRSPFLAFYLLHVIVSCVLLSRRAAITSSVLAFLLLASLVLGEWSGAIPMRNPTAIVFGPSSLTPQFVAVVLAGYFLMFGMSTWLLTGMNRALRRGERRLLRRSVATARLSDLRQDFLRIASHNLRSPIGAATVLLRNLKEGLGGPLSPTQEEWVGRSLRRLEDLSEFMHDLSVLAELQTGVVEEHAETVDLGQLLTQVVDEQRDFAREKDQELVLELPEKLNPVMGIERLLREAVVNYIQNAIRYTPTGGRITVRAASLPYTVRIEVEDNGIGISEENQARLFTAFVRIRAEEPEAEHHEGTGLGLSIVLRIAEFHSGRVGVDSTRGEGSLFYLELPTAVD